MRGSGHSPAGTLGNKRRENVRGESEGYCGTTSQVNKMKLTLSCQLSGAVERSTPLLPCWSTDLNHI